MMSENGHYSYSSIMGAFKSNRNSLSGIKRATIDFELAKLFPSPFGHVELSSPATTIHIAPGSSLVIRPLALISETIVMPIHKRPIMNCFVL